MRNLLAAASSLRFRLALVAAIVLALIGQRVYARHWGMYAHALTVAAAPAAASAAAQTPASGPDRGNVMPWVYSELWSDASPFKKTVAAHKAAGATVLDHSSMDALWNQGIAGNATADVIPIFVASASDPVLQTICTKYGGNCNAKNVSIHVPPYAVAQHAGDGHLTIIDQHAPGGAVEIDCWQAVIAAGTLACSWAGRYGLGTTALDTGGEGVHAGMAVTSVFLTGQEIANGHVDHALAINAVCLNDPMVFPSNVGGTSDTTCDKTRNPPHYGDLVHLLLTADQIATSAYSAPCKVILTALATYGAYLDDTGDNGLQLHTQSESSYVANRATAAQDPWPAIQAQLDAAGDGNGTHWESCLNRLQSSNFELLELKAP